MPRENRLIVLDPLPRRVLCEQTGTQTRLVVDQLLKYLSYLPSRFFFDSTAGCAGPGHTRLRVRQAESKKERKKKEHPLVALVHTNRNVWKGE